MVGETEVVVGAEVKDLAAVDLDLHPLWPLQVALALEQPLLTDGVELAVQPPLEFGWIHAPIVLGRYPTAAELMELRARCATAKGESPELRETERSVAKPGVSKRCVLDNPHTLHRHQPFN